MSSRGRGNRDTLSRLKAQEESLSKKAESRLPSAKGTQNAVREGQAPLSLSRDAAAPQPPPAQGTWQGGGLDAPLTAGRPQPNTVLSNNRLYTGRLSET